MRDLALLAWLWPQLAVLAGGQSSRELVYFGLSIAAVSMVLIAWRSRAMDPGTTAVAAATMGLRTIGYCLLMAATWQAAVPDFSWKALLTLTTVLMVVCRLPIILNKDLALAGGVALLVIVAEAALLALSQLWDAKSLAGWKPLQPSWGVSQTVWQRELAALARARHQPAMRGHQPAARPSPSSG